GGAVWGLALGGGGRRRRGGGSHPRLRLWDVTDGRSLHELAGHAGAVHGVGFSLDGRRAVSSGADGTIVEWGLPAFSVPGASPVIGEVRRFEGLQARGVDRVAVSPDGNRAVTAGLDHLAILCELHTGQPAHRFNHGGPVHFVAFSQDGRRLVTFSEDRTVRVLDPVKGGEGARF